MARRGSSVFHTLISVETLQKAGVRTYPQSQTKHTTYILPHNRSMESSFNQIKKWKPNAYGFQVHLVRRTKPVGQAAKWEEWSTDPHKSSRLATSNLSELIEKYLSKEDVETFLSSGGETLPPGVGIQITALERTK